MLVRDPIHVFDHIIGQVEMDFNLRKQPCSKQSIQNSSGRLISDEMKVDRVSAVKKDTFQ